MAGEMTLRARYMVARLKDALVPNLKSYLKGDLSSAQLSSNVASELRRKRLTWILEMTGRAMAPTLNPASPSASAEGDKRANLMPVERLLIRSIKEPSPRNLFVGDVVVAFAPHRQPSTSSSSAPLSSSSSSEPASSSSSSSSEGDPDALLVRRIAALPGDEMASRDESESGFVLEPGQCWVLCDNEEGGNEEVGLDSRNFGPLDMYRIIGRIIYQTRSPVDHGPVQNSEQARIDDAVLLEVEVDGDMLALMTSP